MIEVLNEIDEYTFCVEEIERYRTLREEIEAKVADLRRRKAAGLALNPICDVSVLERQIATLLDDDEVLGAKMHELTIKRNLLEP